MDKERWCPACGRIIPFDARICPYCNKKFEEPIIVDEKYKQEQESIQKTEFIFNERKKHENKTKTIILILVPIMVILIIAAIFLLLSIKPPLNVTITDLYSIKAEYGDGKTLFMNITFESNGNEGARIGNPVIITNQGRELYCDFIKVDEGIDFVPGGLSVPAHKILHVTIKTWDIENFSMCLPSGETPRYFQYNLGSGQIFAPSIHKVKIPDNLIKNVQ